MLIRKCEDENILAIMFETINGHKTLKYKIDESKQMLPLKYPIHLDISLGTKCFGNCNYCYANSLIDGIYYLNVVNKLKELFDKLGNNKPFQIAIGGEGEPTQHPEFIDILKTIKSYNIIPNYTTNAMKVNNDLLMATKENCGCIAISTHKHLEKLWSRNIEKFLEYNIKTRLHVIIGDKNSSDNFIRLYNKYYNRIDGITILLLRQHGRATENTIFHEDEFLKVVNFLKDNDHENIAFTEFSYNLLKKYNREVSFLDIASHEEGLFGGYIKMDQHLTIFKSSYNLQVKGEIV
jgi:organic radical activating enzyme